MRLSGLGEKSATLRVYIANRPDFADIKALDNIRPIKPGEITDIGNRCGNGWRKVFNVYAKLLYALNDSRWCDNSAFDSWQQFRDTQLLQLGSDTSLLFSPWEADNTGELHLIMGRTYAKSLSLPENLKWENDEFAICETSKLIVSPYFDYRQLSNQKIVYLVELIGRLSRE